MIFYWDFNCTIFCIITKRQCKLLDCIVPYPLNGRSTHVEPWYYFAWIIADCSLIQYVSHNSEFPLFDGSIVLKSHKYVLWQNSKSTVFKCFANVIWDVLQFSATINERNYKTIYVWYNVIDHDNITEQNHIVQRKTK